MTQFALPTLTIASGQTLSNALTKRNLQHARVITIHAPETLPEAVVVEVAGVDGATAGVGDYRDLQSNGADITLPADSSITIIKTAFFALRLRAGGAVGADRIFLLTGEDET